MISDDLHCVTYGSRHSTQLNSSLLETRTVA